VDGKRHPDGMRATAVLFDLDGVIVDSRRAFAGSVNHALAAHGLPVRDAAELHAFIGPPLHGTFRELAGELADACVASYREHYTETSARETVVFDGMREALAHLGARVPLGVATSKPAALAEPLLEALGLRDHFAVIAGPSLEAEAEEKSVTLGRALAVLDSGGAEPVMIGDRRYDMAAAHAHGLAAVGVTWGIGDEAELRGAGADAIVHAPHELAAALGLSRAPAG
jgi:phosphoglycolate phosphatase